MTVADFAHSVEEEGRRRRKLLPFRSLTGTSLVTAAEKAEEAAKGSFANAASFPPSPIRLLRHLGALSSEVGGGARWEDTCPTCGFTLG